MDNELKMSEGSKEVESTVKITRKEFEDGSSEEVRVEQVDGGFIKTICKKYKDKDGCWQWDEEKSVHTEDPMRDNSTEGIVSRLEQVLKNIM
jgi:major membrane immunogen (membrane-anchored lipoprotein)